jgi:hypothetical protein
MRSFFYLSAILMLARALVGVSLGAQSQSLSDHIPAVVKLLNLKPLGPLPASQRIRLAIGLPLRNREALTNLLEQIYEPTSPNYRRYLNPAQFRDRFAPSEQDYQAVVEFAQTNRWRVISKSPGRIVLGVEADVSDIERACNVHLRLYQHPTESRQFFAPDAEPSLDLATPILTLDGINDFVLPRPAGLRSHRPSHAGPDAGSAQGGALMGYDFRSAFAPGVNLTGAGQTIGLLELDGYYTNDITAYEVAAGLPNVPITNVLIGGFDGTPSTRANYVGEVSLDIEMAISMAPGAAGIVVYESSHPASPIEILAHMAQDNSAAQLSSSWSFGDNATVRDLLQQIAAQGQSFFQSSGDDGAYLSGVTAMPHAGPPADNPWVTSVGGTTLTTSGPGGFRVSETVWNGYINGEEPQASGGGASLNFELPFWQQGTSMSANQISKKWRNLPDVAMVADNVWVAYNNGETDWFWGTSCATPLWAGFAALVNQAAAQNGNPPVGFLNPALYQLGNRPDYSALFHDITTGNNTNFYSYGAFPAVPGYDLCTGWGTPKGMNLIHALAAPDDGLTVFPFDDACVNGAVGGPFNNPTRIFTLSNAGPHSIAWTVATDCSWLAVSPAEGVLAPGGPAVNVRASLTPAAASLGAGLYSGSVVFQNKSSAAKLEGASLPAAYQQRRQFVLQTGLSPVMFDDLAGSGLWVPPGYAGLDWPNFAFFDSVTGTTDEPGFLNGVVSQSNVIFNDNASTASIVGVSPFDLISAYLTAADGDCSVEATASLDGTTLYELDTYINPSAPILVQFNFFGVDRVDFTCPGLVMDNVLAIAHAAPIVPPTLQLLAASSNAVSFAWTAQIGQSYQLQSEADPSQTNWTNVGAPVTATNILLQAFDFPTNPLNFYRLLALP